MLRLAQAASSENYSAWGVPPNQRRTGATKQKPGGNMDGELNIVPFYGGWEYVFRPLVDEAAESIALLTEGAVENGSHVGYSQNNGQYPREGVFDALFQMAKPDTRKIKTLVNCDCTSLGGASVYHSGEKDARLYSPELRTMWSGTAREILMRTGAFTELTDPLLLELGTGLKRGDILLKTGHMAIAIDTDDHLDTFPVRLYNCSYSRIRKGPGIEYDTLAILPVGTILHAIGTATDEDGLKWYRVYYAGFYGYTSETYAEQLPTASCTADTWLRKDAGTSGESIIVIPKGATVYLTGKEKKAYSGAIKRTWYEAIYGGHQGWASSLNIKK